MPEQDATDLEAQNAKDLKAWDAWYEAHKATRGIRGVIKDGLEFLVLLLGLIFLLLLGSLAAGGSVVGRMFTGQI